MHIHYITDTRNGLKIGERNQVLGVVDALRVIYNDAILLEHDIGEIDRLKGVLQKYTKQLHIIIGVSEAGVAVFSQLSPSDNHIVVLMGHEVPQNIKNILNKIHILAVPGYVTQCPAQLEGIKIVRTDGVSNTMTKEKALSAYKDWQSRFPITNDQTVIVAMLGGSVDGRDYAPGEARKMAEYIAARAKRLGAYIVASDSPRSKQQDTEDFTSVLSNSGCNSAFFPFDMKNQNNETPYRAMVGLAARDARNSIIVAGDSVSMPCEIAQAVLPQQLYLYPVSNGNLQNNEFVEWMIRNGRAGLVDIEKFTEKHEKVLTVSMNAARQIADAVLTRIKAVKNIDN